MPRRPPRTDGWISPRRRGGTDRKSMENNTWALRGAKYGAITAVIGGAVAMAIFTALALLKTSVFGHLCVLEGSVLSNVLGAAISFVVLAIGGMIAGAAIGLL